MRGPFLMSSYYALNLSCRRRDQKCVGFAWQPLHCENHRRRLDQCRRSNLWDSQWGAWELKKHVSNFNGSKLKKNESDFFFKPWRPISPKIL